MTKMRTMPRAEAVMPSLIPMPVTMNRVVVKTSALLLMRSLPLEVPGGVTLIGRSQAVVLPLVLPPLSHLVLARVS